MTGKQIETRENELHSILFNKVRELTPEEKTELKELDTRDMINSCLIYSSNFFGKSNRWVYGEGYRYCSYADEYAKDIGMDRVKQLYDEQLSDFKKATVHKNVFTDGEGVSYNSIEWADDKETA